MKMKQKLAATLAGVMALSMVPATSVFAYSANKVTKQEKASTSGLTIDTSMVFEVTGKIQKDDTFILKESSGKKFNISNGTVSGDFVYYVDGSTMHVKYTGDEALVNPTLEVPIKIKKATAEGDIKVTVDSNGTAISSGEYVVGTIVAKGVTAKIATAYLPEGATKTTLGKITLTENIAGMLPTKDAYITLKLTNSSLSFKPFSEIDKEDSVAGSTAKKAEVTGINWTGKLGATGLSDSLTSAYVSDDGMSIYIPVSLASKTSSLGYVELPAGTITVYKDPDVDDYIGDVQVRLLDGWVEEGTVYYEKVGVTENKFTIFSDKAQQVNVKAAKATSLVAGRLDDTNKDGARYTNVNHKTAQITITEEALGSIDGEVKFDFPEGVKILAYDLVDGKGTGLVSVEVNGVVTSGIVEDEFDVTVHEEDMSKPYKPQVIINVDNPSEVNRRDKADLDIIFYLSVSADYEYDTIDVDYETSLTGSRDKVEGTLTIANVQKPVEVTAVSSVIDESLKRQELGEVTIKENLAGGLVSGGYVYVELEDGVYFDEDKGSVAVKDGDVSVGKLKQYKNSDGEVYAVGFYVDEASTKPSSVVVSGLQTSTKNTAGGYYELKVYGDAIAANDIVLDGDQAGEDLSTEAKKNRAAKSSAEYFNAGTLVVEDYVTINRELLNGNKAPENNNKTETQTVTLKKGDLTYTRADGTKGKMVAAPYINYDANGGGITMVPIRAIGEILGAEVEWFQATKTATFTMPDGRFAQITLGSPVARAVDGSQLTMNWAAEVPAGVDGGIYAPIRYMARVLGFEDGTVDYDYTNQCVVIQAPVLK